MHSYAFDVSLADPSTSPPTKSQHGDTTYYFFETQDLPLFGPLRTLGVPESLIDVVEPFFRVLVELGYDRSIPPWEPTPARLIPTLDPATVAADLVDAIGEGINNAAGPIRFAIAAEHSRGAAHRRAARRGAGTPSRSAPTVADDAVDVCRRATVGNADVDAGRPNSSRIVADVFAGRRPFANDDGTAVEPDGVPKDKAGTTTTNNSLTTTDLTLPSTLAPLGAVEWAVGQVGQPVHPGCHRAGRDAKRNDEHAVDDGHHDDNHRHHHDDNDHRYQYDDRRFKQRGPSGHADADGSVSTVLAGPARVRPALRSTHPRYSHSLDHRLGPGDVSFEAKRFRHRAVAIHDSRGRQCRRRGPAPAAPATAAARFRG